MPYILTEPQETAIERYLAETPKTCSECGGGEWELVGIAFPGGGPYFDGDVVLISKPCVELECVGCRHSTLVSFEQARLPGEAEYVMSSSSDPIA